MKTLNSLLFFLLVGQVFGQYTSIPDNNFEQKLIDLGYDNQIDGQVLDSNIDTITVLDLSFSNIADLSGIEGFVSLKYLDLEVNDLTTMDISQNNALLEINCKWNALYTIDVSQNINLEVLDCDWNFLTSINTAGASSLQYLSCFSNYLNQIDVSQNLQLKELRLAYGYISSLDVSALSNLELLACGGMPLQEIDVTNNPNLQVLSIVNCPISNLDLSQNGALTQLFAHNDSLLTCINLNNGNNINMSYMQAYSDPSLFCIQVDDSIYSANTWTWQNGSINMGMTFSESCFNDCMTYLGIEEINLGPKELVKIIDLTGREVIDQPNKVLIYIYSDGTTEKVFRIE